MTRTIACFVTALLTFLAGVALYSSYRRGVELISEDGDVRTLIEPLTVEHQESQVPLRLGIFMGVDGVTFSSDNSKFNLFDDYTDRETAIMVSPKELSDIVHKLVAAGLLREEECTPSFISLPMVYTIIIRWPDGVREFTWIKKAECRVPEKYLSVLEEANVRYDVPLIEDFINYNRR